VESNTIEVYIHMLRKKLGNGFIKNVRGIGYKVAAEPA
jgi:DNA-binding response OmpR family regulator